MDECKWRKSILNFRISVFFSRFVPATIRAGRCSCVLSAFIENVFRGLLDRMEPVAGICRDGRNRRPAFRFTPNNTIQ